MKETPANANAGSNPLDRVLDALDADTDDLEALAGVEPEVLDAVAAVLWEADPLTFQFTYISPSVEQVFGYPRSEWFRPHFWKERIVHPDDVADAVAHCAVATARGADHDFEYRAMTARGDVVRVRDVVRVLKGPLGFARKLRGVFVPVA